MITAQKLPKQFLHKGVDDGLEQPKFWQGGVTFDLHGDGNLS
jgi:hypothetical protein